MTNTDIDILAAKIAGNLCAQPRWLKLKAAAKYSSIGEKELINLAKAREVDGFQDLDNSKKPWIFDRVSIDEYRSNQLEKFNNPDEDERIALEIVRSL